MDNVFSIGDIVYHVLPESPKGIVIDWRYQASTNLYEYQVCFAIMQSSMWYFSHELSDKINYK